MKEAELAAGACCRAGDLVVEENETAICLVRPPGHHAERGAGMGFCLLNNAAVATRHLQSAGAGRVAIVDIDVHHGNGTQEVFWEDGSVLYVSIHQWPWYPWATGSLYEAGTGDGEWKNVNVPLPAGSGDDVYLAAMTRVVDPVVSAFDPELIVVSAGFDAHERDPLSLMEVTSPGFGVMGAVLAEMAGRLCAGRMLVVLEGGYDPVGTSTSLAAFVDALWWGGERVLSSSSFPPVESAAAFHLPRLELA